MSETTITLPNGEPHKILVCEAITDEGRHCTYFPEPKKEEGKLVYRQKFYRFDFEGEKIDVCEKCFKVWMTEPERIQFTRMALKLFRGGRP